MGGNVAHFSSVKRESSKPKETLKISQELKEKINYKGAWFSQQKHEMLQEDGTMLPKI